jgi:Protein of unknown function (DUF2949)
MLEKLIKFLHSELDISVEEIAIAQKQDGSHPNILPIILWQYGLLSLEQLDSVFDWLETI